MERPIDGESFCLYIDRVLVRPCTPATSSGSVNEANKSDEMNKCCPSRSDSREGGLGIARIGAWTSWVTSAQPAQSRNVPQDAVAQLLPVTQMNARTTSQERHTLEPVVTLLWLPMAIDVAAQRHHSIQKGHSALS